MSPRRPFRDQPGPKPSEGARLFCLVLRRRRLTPAEATKLLGAPTGMVTRLAYGDRKPAADWANRIERVFGVPAATWGQKPSRPFVPGNHRFERARAA